MVNKIIVFLNLLLLLLLACTAQQDQNQNDDKDQKHTYTNKLIETNSPYLLQHAHNPVNWYPWGEEALTKAIKENKMIIISIGYAACHWCHVMEKESFEDTTVARIMNENFISIKIDREERPDIDQIYMNVAYLTNKRGGWPLNAFALPDSRPVYAGTYFPKDNWIQVLEFFAGKFRDSKQELITKAEQLTKGIQQSGWIQPKVEVSPMKEDQFKESAKSIINSVDFKRGGLNREPKFPMPNVYQFLLRYHHATNDEQALQAVVTTLTNMARGGIYDHLGGGFARYSTDNKWKVPHFEKMLYDNGQLVSLYSEAYQVTKNELFKDVVYETLEFISREMTSPEGVFYSSLDADSEGEEGKFYVWEKQDIDNILGDDSGIINSYYSVTNNGNWDGKNILHNSSNLQDIISKYNVSEEKFKEILKVSKDKLFHERTSRIRPTLDDKGLTAWNALMLKGYIDAYKVFDEPEFLNTAIKNANFLLNSMRRKDGGLNRNYKDGKSAINGFLDDYSFTIEAFISLYQATFDEKWLHESKALADYALSHFYDEDAGMFFYTSDLDPKLISRSKEVTDNVIPASNSSMAKGLFQLGLYFYNNDYLDLSKQMLANVIPNIGSNGSFYSNWITMLYMVIHEPFEIAIVGDNYDQVKKQFDQFFIPNAIFSGGRDEGTLELLKYKKVDGQTIIYVCKDKVCKLPVREVSKAMGLMVVE